MQLTATAVDANSSIRSLVAARPRPLTVVSSAITTSVIISGGRVNAVRPIITVMPLAALKAATPALSSVTGPLPELGVTAQTTTPMLHVRRSPATAA